MAKEFKELKADIATILEEHGVKFRLTTTGELIMDSCWNCGRAKKMYVSSETGAFICFRCGVKGPPVVILQKYAGMDYKDAMKALYGKGEKEYAGIKSIEEDDEELVPDNFKLSLTGLMKFKKTTGDISLPDPIELAPEFKILTKDSNPVAFQYLVKRGYTEEIIEDLKLYTLPYATFQEAWSKLEQKYGKENKKTISDIAKIQGRIVFPLYVDNQIMGYVARDYTGTKEPKVLNSVGNFRSFSIWNYDLSKESPELVVCEGTTSAVKCGHKRSIALLGKTATPGQIRLIRQTKAKKLYLCLDIGTEKEQAEIYKALAIYFPGKIFKLNLPPVIEIKSREIDDGEVQSLKDLFKVELFVDRDTKLVHFPYSGKGDIYRQSGVDPKLPSDQKREKLSFYLEKHGQSHLEGLLFWLMFEGEYKDSGDYSFEEMNEFIQLSTPFSGGPRAD